MILIVVDGPQIQKNPRYTLNTFYTVLTFWMFKKNALIFKNPIQIDDGNYQIIILIFDNFIVIGYCILY